MKDKVTPVVLALVAVALLAALWSSPPVVESPQPSEEVPDFSFDVNGRALELSALRGQVVLLNFWASWCPPCVEEMPALSRLHQQISASGGMVLGISVDDDEAKYQKFLQDHQITFPNYRDPDRRLSTLYGTFKYPETFIIDRQGRLVRKIIGPLEWDDPQVLDFLTRLL